MNTLIYGSWRTCKFKVPAKFFFLSRIIQSKMFYSREMYNHYEVLGVPETASSKTIKEAFIKLSKKHHPDCSSGKDFHLKYLRIVEAYSVLSKNSSRKEYDLNLRRMPSYHKHFYQQQNCGFEEDYLYWKHCRDMNRQPPSQDPMSSKYFGLAVGLAIISFGIVLSFVRIRYTRFVLKANKEAMNMKNSTNYEIACENGRKPECIFEDLLQKDIKTIPLLVKTVARCRYLGWCRSFVEVKDWVTMSALRVRALLRTCKPLQCSVRLSSDHHGGATPERMKEHLSTINDMPVPSGSWQEDHSKRNRALNIKLGSALAALVVTALFVSQTKTFYRHRIGDVTKIDINP